MNKLQVLRFLLICILITGCGSAPQHYYYIQPPQQVPLFKEKNDLLINGGFGAGKHLNCSSIQAAYSPTKHIGVMADYASVKLKAGGPTGDFSTENYYSGAVGYFKKLKVFREKAIVEIYGGVGTGKQHHTFVANEVIRVDTVWFFGTYTVDIYGNVNKGNSELVYMKYFIQPSIGVNTEFFRLSFSLRTSYLDFIHVNNQVNSSYFAYREIENIRKVSKTTMIEPAITVSFGIKFFHFQLQYAMTNINSSAIKYDDHNFSFGLNLLLGNIFKKIKEENRYDENISF